MNFVNVTAKLKLPAAECYNVFQDRKGYLWICSEAGLCRYNGNELLVFNKNNGLHERAIYASMEDERGTLWLVTSGSRVLIVKNTRLEEAPFSPAYKGLMRTLDITYSIKKMPGNKLLLSNYTGSFEVNLTNNAIHRITGRDTANYVSFKKMNGELLPLNGFVQKRLVVLPKNKDEKLSFGIFDSTRHYSYSVPFGKTLVPHPRYLSCRIGNDLFISIDDKLIRIRDMKMQYTVLKSQIISLYADKDNGLWAGTYKNGVNYFASPSDLTRSMLLLPDISVTGTCEDHEGNIWVSSLEKGIFLCRNKNIISFANVHNLDKPVEMLKMQQGKVYASAGFNRIVELNDSSQKEYGLRFSGVAAAADIMLNDHARIVGSKNSITIVNRQLQQVKNVMMPDGSTSMYKMTLTDDNELYGVSFSAVLKIMGERGEYAARLSSKATDICYIADGNFLIGCIDGLYAFSRRDTVIKKLPGIYKTVNRIFRAGDGTVWIATKEEGLYKFSNNKAELVSDKIGLPTDVFFDIAEDKDHDLWIGSNIGLIHYGKKGTLYYNTSNGLPANEVFRIAINDRYIYTSTVEGVSRMPLPKDITGDKPPLLYFNTFKVNNEIKDTSTGSLTFPYNKNDLEFSFDILAFDMENKTSLLYTINDEKPFVAVKGRVLKLDNLDPGAYKLTVYGVNSEGTKSIVPVIVQFTIGAPFWKNWLFILAAVLIAGALVYFIFNKRIQRIQKKADEQTRLNKLIASSQLSALQAQMNPHFIFNSINSIQHFILEKKEKDAYAYLAKFSKLIRIVLNNSEKVSIPLYQEIDTLRTYIELEQLRFNNKFEYELHVDDAIDEQELFIPPMLVQPYVENAIWHGLLNLGNERKGRLRLNFSLAGNLLHITIQDNGIGRTRAASIRKENVYTPVAMKLTEKRLQMVHKIWGGSAIKVIVDDLYDDKQMPAGTSVSLFLPLNIQLQEDER